MSEAERIKEFEFLSVRLKNTIRNAQGPFGNPRTCYKNFALSIVSSTALVVKAIKEGEHTNRQLFIEAFSFINHCHPQLEDLYEISTEMMKQGMDEICPKAELDNLILKMKKIVGPYIKEIKA